MAVPFASLQGMQREFISDKLKFNAFKALSFSFTVSPSVSSNFASFETSVLILESLWFGYARFLVKPQTRYFKTAFWSVVLCLQMNEVRSHSALTLKFIPKLFLGSYSIFSRSGNSVPERAAAGKLAGKMSRYCVSFQ